MGFGANISPFAEMLTWRPQLGQSTFGDCQGAENDGRRSLRRRWHGDFLTLERDADTEDPIYRRGKAEHAKIRK